MARVSDRVYQQLREEILDWSLPPGAPLAEVELAGRLGVSRTPLRTALSQLVADGLASTGSGRGVNVAAVSVRDVRDVFELRLALEQQAARLAAGRRDEAVFAALVATFDAQPDPDDTRDPDRAEYYALVSRMDEAIDDAVDNRFLVGALRALRTHVARLRRLAKDDPARLRAAHREHRLIAEAIRAGDADLAAHATHLHLHHSLMAVLARAGHRQEAPPTAEEPR